MITNDQSSRGAAVTSADEISKVFVASGCPADHKDSTGSARLRQRVLFPKRPRDPLGLGRSLDAPLLTQTSLLPRS